jgi:hypothetical protein
VITNGPPSRPPHFHARYGEDKAEYDIRTLQILIGKLPKRAHLLVVEWALEHREELLINWGKAVVPASLEKIKPLE